MTLDERITTLQTNNETEHPHYATLLAMQKDHARNLPFVVAAMTRTEAQELLSEKAEVFDNAVNEDIKPKQTKRFRQFKHAFNQAFPTDARKNDWLAHYGEHSRADWIPHLYPPDARYGIVTLLEEESLSRYRRMRSTKGERLPVKKSRDFWPDFIKQETLFDRKRDMRDDAWRSLSSSRVLVIDGFSLFHPVIRNALESSELNFTRNPGAALLLAVPEHPKAADSLETLFEMELQEEINNAFTRFDADFDPVYAFELTTERRLKRWLHVSAVELLSRAVEVERPYPGNMTFFASQLRGIAETIEQGGGRQ